MPYVFVAALGNVPANILDFAGDCLRRSFGLRPVIGEKPLDIRPAYDDRRKQYHASILLRGLLEAAPADAVKVVGITEADIFLPIFTFLFGQAQLDGRGSLLSLNRLRNSFYGFPDDENLFLDRVRKEIIHELGHNYGLRHCYDPHCVMRSSTYVEDVDQKTGELCSTCRRWIEGKLRFEIG